jgi:hypothetical protein
VPKTQIAKMRHRLCPADRDTYGDPPGSDGWVIFDPDALCDLPGSKLSEIENTTGFLIAMFWVPTQRYSALGMRVEVWLARRLAGLVDVWNAFDPKVMQMESEKIDPPAGGDADPPAPGSPPGSPAAP